MLKGKALAIESLGYVGDPDPDRPHPGRPDALQDWWHYSLFYRDPEREAGCPCPKAACGFIESGRESGSCNLHGAMARRMWNFTVRSGHPSRLCVHYVRPMTPHLRHVARQLPQQVARLRRNGLYVPVYEVVEHPSVSVTDEEDLHGEDD